MWTRRLTTWSFVLAAALALAAAAGGTAAGTRAEATPAGVKASLVQPTAWAGAFQAVLRPDAERVAATTSSEAGRAAGHVVLLALALLGLALLRSRPAPRAGEPNERRAGLVRARLGIGLRGPPTSLLAS